MFVLEEGRPNALAPGKRPRTSLVSYLICDKGVLATSIEAPRFSTQTLVNSFYPRVYRPGQLYRAAMSGLVDAASEVKDKGTFGYVDRTTATPELNGFMQP